MATIAAKEASIQAGRRDRRAPRTPNHGRDEHTQVVGEELVDSRLLCWSEHEAGVEGAGVHRSIDGLQQAARQHEVVVEGLVAGGDDSRDVPG
jgi:hypothetical protein